MKRLALVGLALVGVCGQARGQGVLDSVLVGIREVRVSIRLQWDSRITTMTEEQATAAIRERFTLELRKLGIVINPTKAGLPILACITKVFYPPDGVVAFSRSVEVWDYLMVPRTGNSFHATTWDLGMLGTVGVNNIGTFLDTSGTWCAEKFGNMWLAMNPPRKP